MTIRSQLLGVGALLLLCLSTGDGRSAAAETGSKNRASATFAETFWRNIDPFDPGGQFCDRGRHYRTAIFYEDDEQKEAALASKESLERSGRLPAPIATEIMPLRAFYPAEAEHQDFYQRNVRRYWTYRTGCGRDQGLKQLWK